MGPNEAIEEPYASEIARLESELAAAQKERDEARARVEGLRRQLRRADNLSLMLENERDRLYADNARLREALEAIANSKHTLYENNESSQYGKGVTDGHRYCAKIALAATETTDA